MKHFLLNVLAGFLAALERFPGETRRNALAVALADARAE